MIQRENNLTMLKKVCTDILGSSHQLQFTADRSTENRNQKKKYNQLKQKAIEHPLVADAIEIFGGKLIDVKIL